MNRGKGFTLIELITVIAIIGIFTAVTVPVFLRSLAWWQLDAAASSMTADIRRWQQKAITEQLPGLKIVINKQEKKYLLKEGLLVRESHNLSPLIAAIDVSPAAFATVEFYPSGLTSTAGNFALGDRFGRYKYIIILNTTGRVRISNLPLD